MINSVSDDLASKASTWRTAHGDISDEEWELIADLGELEDLLD
jgi:hypothetical protein